MAAGTSRNGAIALALVVSGFVVGMLWNKYRTEAPPNPSASERAQFLRGMKGAFFAARVVRDGAVVRDSPSDSSRVLKKERKGTEVYAALTPGDWKQVRDGDVAGWMRADELGNPP